MWLEKHGGQFGEGPTDVLVCVVDDSYCKPSGLEETAQSASFSAALEKEFGQVFEEVDVAPGYSVPAFASFVQIVSDYWPALVAAFFLAKPVSDNLGVWAETARKVRRYFTGRDIVLGRNAAAALAIEAVFEEMGGVPKTIRCLGYHWTDRRFDKNDLDDSDGQTIKEGPRTEYLCMAKQVFLIEADGISFEVEVDGKSVVAKRSSSK